MLNKKIINPQSGHTNNLKNIINETKQPLGRYINKKVAPIDKNMSYIEKLKSMLSNNSKIQTQGCQQKTVSDFRGFLTMKPLQQYSEFLPQIEHESPTKQRKYHEKTQSHITTLKNLARNGKSKSPNNNLRFSQKKIFNEDFFNDFKTDVTINNKKRVVSNCYGTTNIYQNRHKLQYINYQKFTPIPKFGDDSNDSKISSRWGKIQLTQVLGAGSNASVREGFCHNKRFAVKIYQKYKLIEPRKKRRVLFQIQLLNSLQEHPNIITMHQAFEDKREIHVIFQFLPNSITLHQYFRSCFLYLEQMVVKKIFLKLVQGVNHLHEQGVAHRDIKPENTLIGFQQDGQLIIKIIDFGYATKNEVDGLHCGTPNFMAPELLQKNTKYSTFPVDIWALGVTLFYLFEGRYPFKGYDQKDLYKSIRQGDYQFKKIQDKQIQDLVRQMLQKNPQKRVIASQLLQRDWLCLN